MMPDEEVRGSRLTVKNDKSAYTSLKTIAEKQKYGLGKTNGRA